MTDAARPPADRFTVGSTMRHVLVMSATGWIGLAAIFFVDFLNLFYISLLKRIELTAAVGFAGGLLFLLVSIGIGCIIAGTALTARAIGARKREEARRIATSATILSFAFVGVPAIVLMIFVRPVLSAMGASGEALEHGAQFLTIVLPSMPLMGVGMMLSGVLRAVADARRAMNVTLAGGIATAILDPIFIFGFGLGIEGAAIVTVISRFVFIGLGFAYVVKVHDMLAPVDFARFRADFRPLMVIGFPAMLTNLATPVSSIYTTAVVATYGSAAIAGNAVLDRLVPLAFGGIFALSGAIGPILGQNYGARRFDRLKRAVTDSVLLTVIYCLIVWGVLALAADGLVGVFGVTGPGADILRFFCYWGAGTFLFTGLMFVANAVFNNLGFPVLSTVFNWGRATLGTIPFVHVGAHYWGPIGITAGWGIGAIVFGIAALAACYGVLGRIAGRAAREDAERAADSRSGASSAHEPAATSLDDARTAN
jgi:putative MATE family efflux protein